MLRYTLRFLALVIILLMMACAQVVTPSGGPKDVAAPKIKLTTPDSGALHFNSKKITILFNEYIQVKDANNQWLISPPMHNFPEYKVKGKKLTITIKDTLKPNTTYTFNFGKSIVDLNENNALGYYQYVMSTGDFIDSLKLSGVVVNSFTGQPEKGLLVMLYDTSKCRNDSFACKMLPDYFGVTDAGGAYNIGHIKNGAYRAVALKDVNSDYIYDSKEELIGFCDTVLNVKKNTSLNIQVFREAERKLYIKSKGGGEYGTFSFVLNRPNDSLKIEYLNKSLPKDWKIEEISKTRDTATIWIKDFSIDTIRIKLSNGDTPIDTLVFPVLHKDKFVNKSKKIVKQRLTVVTKPANSTDKDLNKPVTLRFRYPIKSLTKDSIKLLMSKKEINFNLKKDSISTRLYYIDAKYIPDSSYKLIVIKGAAEDYFGNTNDSTTILFHIPATDALGNMYMKVTQDTSKGKIINSTYKGDFIVQLLDDKDALISEKTMHELSTLEYKNMKPGNYKLKVILDSNKNGKWDSGNLVKKLQPEKIIYYNAALNLRANWDLEEEWKLSY